MVGRDKARCLGGTFPHPPRLEPCLRLSPHTAQHLRSFSVKNHQAFLRISSVPQEFTRVRLARSLSTFVPVFLKARGLRHWASWTPLCPCARLSRAPTTTPLPPLPLWLCGSRGHWSFREALAPSLLPTDLRIPGEASRVQHGGLKQDVLGGVFLVAPSALCGSPVLARGRSGLSVLPSAMQCHFIASVHTPTDTLWFLAPLADILGKVCQGADSP